MSPAKNKLHRLERLKMVRTRAAEAAERRLSDLCQATEAAEGRRRLILDLLGACNTAPGPAAHAVLLSAASLRKTLQEALREATERALEQGKARDAAARTLAHVQGRMEQTNDALRTARVRFEDEAEEREQDDRGQSRRKVPT